jgi:murein DD-endopeptidase MepM/ murein hydrolase activator NlpD
MPKLLSTKYLFELLLLGCLVIVMAFTPQSSYDIHELLVHADSTTQLETTENPKESTIALFDTANVFSEHWNNDNLFPYSYPKKCSIPDSAYFVLCDSQTEFCIPRNGGINSPFGPRSGVMHKGLDIHLAKGDAVKSVLAGKVRYAQFNTGGYGNLVVLRHPNGLETYYAHLTNITVKANEWVESGALIGTGGNTGAEWTGDHLHFEMRYRDLAFDPLIAIDWTKKELKTDTLVIYKKYLHNADGVKSTPNQASKTASVSKSVARYHTVKRGETLYYIARRYDKSVLELRKLNHIGSDAKISIGQRIRLT